ncbi:hypothetical protein [Streptomyces sp. URMC 123]|uniref:hypothetical protein n=1 Tax=Streptomyces sp. URMC 123 TaxID=3423403 RepID=UPI003F1BF0C1
MNDSPGWASPGSSPSDKPDQGTPQPPEQPAPADANTPPNWSSQQPPAGQWSIPGAPGGPGNPPPPGGAPGPGGTPGPGGAPGSGWGPVPPPGGWGGPGGGWPPAGGWQQPPAAAKPGVIPLRPLGIGEILDGAVATMRAHWRTVLGISLAVAIVAQTLATVVTGLWLDNATLESLGDDSDPTFDEVMNALGGSLAGSAVNWLIVMLGTLVATAMLTVVVSRAVLGRPVSATDAWRNSRPQLLRLLGLLTLLPLLLAVVTAVAVAPGFGLLLAGWTGAGAALLFVGVLAAAVVVTWLWVRFSLAPPALMLERQDVLASMRRSAKLVRGAWWRVFGIQLLTALLLLLVSAIIEVPAAVVGVIIGGEDTLDWLSGEGASAGWPFLIATGVGTVISSTITFPISAGVTALLYMDQRIRREALDLELARAAGLPGYGSRTPGAAPLENGEPGS